MNFWQERTLREKIILTTGAIFCLFLGLYYFIIPLIFTSSMEQDRQRFQQQLSFVRWSQHVEPYVKSFKTIDFNLLDPSKTSDWPNALRQSLGNSSLSEALNMISQANSQINLKFQHANFDQLISHIYGWELLGFKIINLSASRTVDPGYANITLIMTIPNVGAMNET